jgi:hypothetical protein
MLKISNELEGLRPFAWHFLEIARDYKSILAGTDYFFCKHGALKKQILKA